MAQEIKNTFLKSKMNKDLDDRILPNGEYRDARNISVGRSEDDDVGALENIIGNNLITSTELNIPNLEIIGIKESAVNNTFYIFLTDYTDPNPLSPTKAPLDSHHYIYAFNTLTENYSKLIEGRFLNFSKTNRIFGINVLESLLFWTDNRNQPRKINTSVFSEVSQGGRTTDQQYYTQEHQISVAKYSPFEAIKLYKRAEVTVLEFDPTLISVTIAGDQVEQLTPYIDAAVVSQTVASLTGSDYIFVNSLSLNGDGNTVITFNIPIQLAPDVGDILFLIKSTMTNEDSNNGWAGDPNYLEDLFVRFSYRFKYEDNEYSLMAPFTQIAFIPKQKGYFIKGDEEATYRSTILGFMENNVQNIGLLIALPDLANRIASSYKISEIEVLFRKSDEVAVRVLESVPISQVISSSDPNSNIFTYDYQSRKSYKTLSEAQTTRVYDKVPVTAFTQESAGNRIIYGNYKDQHTPPSSIDYNCRIAHKTSSGISNNFIEYPNHTVKRNRNYQIGFVLSDKYGRQSPVILSRVDQGTGSSSNFYSGSTIYSSYDAAAIDTDPVKWFGDSIILSLNSAIQSTYNAGLGTPGLYAIPQKNQSAGDGFAIGTGGSTSINGNTWIFRYTGGSYPLNQNIPEIGDYLRGEYTDFVEVLNITGPFSNLYTVTTNGQVSSEYLPTINQPVGYPDIRFAYNLNELGWYSYKIVVKQTQQEYYNVYLPGILDGYPGQNLLPNSEIIGEGTLEGAFPSDEIGVTAHAVLINDNINKVPRDLAEIGPDQKQFRSSVRLFGRVTNFMKSTVLEDEPDPSNLQYYPTVPGSKNAISHTVTTISTARDLNMSFTKLSNNEESILTATFEGTAVNQTEFSIDNMTAEQLANSTIKVEATPPGQQQFELTAYSIVGNTLKLEDPTGIQPVNSTIILTATGQGVAAGGADGNKVYYQIDSNPLIAKISTEIKSIGWAADNIENPLENTTTGVYDWNMQPYLAIYETEPVESLLDIYWETTSGGYIADINTQVISGFDGITSLGQPNFDFTEASVPGEPITNYFEPINSQGVFIDDTEAELLSVYNGEQPAMLVTDQFELEIGTLAPDIGKYRLKIAGTSPGFTFTENSYINDVFTFTIQSSVNGIITENEITGIQYDDGALKNIVPDFNNITAQQWPLDTTTILPASTWTDANVRNGSYVDGAATDGLLFSMREDPNESINPIALFGWSMNSINGEITQPAGSSAAGTYRIFVKVEDANGVINNPNETNYGSLEKEQLLTVIIGDDSINPELISGVCISNPDFPNIDGTFHNEDAGPVLVQGPQLTFEIDEQSGGNGPGFSSGIWFITAEDVFLGEPGVENNGFEPNQECEIFEWNTGVGGELLVGKGSNNTGQRGSGFKRGYPDNWPIDVGLGEDDHGVKDIYTWAFRMGTGAHTAGSLAFNMTVKGTRAGSSNNGRWFGVGFKSPTGFDPTPDSIFIDGEIKMYVRRVGEGNDEWKELSNSSIPEINNNKRRMASITSAIGNSQPFTDWPRQRTGGSTPNTGQGVSDGWGIPWQCSADQGWANFIRAIDFNKVEGEAGLEYAIVVNGLVSSDLSDDSGPPYNSFSKDVASRSIAYLTIDDLNNPTCVPWQNKNAVAEIASAYRPPTNTRNAFVYKRSNFGNEREYAPVGDNASPSINQVIFAKTPYSDYVTTFYEDKQLTTPFRPDDNGVNFLNYCLSIGDPNNGFAEGLPAWNYGDGNKDFNIQNVARFDTTTGLRDEDNEVAHYTEALLIGNYELDFENFVFKNPLGTDNTESGSLNTGASRLKIKDPNI